MDDLISRQQAIYEIHEDADWLAAQGSDWQTERMERDKSILMSLPSVQPEQRWIPVTEALPEEYGEYLVTYKSDGKQIFMDIVEYETSYEFDHEKNRFKGNWLFADDCRSVNPEVLAWMPLPERYQGGEIR